MSMNNTTQPAETMTRNQMQEYLRWYEQWRWDYWNNRARELRRSRHQKQSSRRSRRR